MLLLSFFISFVETVILSVMAMRMSVCSKAEDILSIWLAVKPMLAATLRHEFTAVPTS